MDEQERPEELPPFIRAIIGAIERARMEALAHAGMEEAHDIVADTVMPSQEQLALAPGDLFLVAPEHGVDVLAGEVLRHDALLDQVPDMDIRLKNGFIPATIYTTGIDGEIGFIHAAKCVKLTRWQWDEVIRWIEGNMPESYPPWLVAAVNENAVGLARSNPQRPEPLACTECGSAAFVLRLEAHTVVDLSVGPSRTEEGVLEATTKWDEQEKQEAYWLCLHCGYRNSEDVDAALRYV